MDRFLIFALERSGSSSLAAALNLELSVVQEPFSSQTGALQNHPRFIELVTENGLLPEHLPEPGYVPYAFNRYHVLALNKDRCGDYLSLLYGQFQGLKHVWNTVSREANLNILEWCLDHDIRIIFLTRENLLRSQLSRQLAQQAKVFQLGAQLQHKEQWEQAGFEPIDVQEFFKELDKTEKNAHFYREFLKGRPHFFLTYEQLYQGSLRRRKRVFQSLCVFLSTTPSNLNEQSINTYLFSKERKQTRSVTLRRVPNYYRLLARHLFVKAGLFRLARFFYHRSGLRKLYHSLLGQ